MKRNCLLILGLCLLLFTQCQTDIHQDIDQGGELDCGQNGQAILGSCQCDEGYSGEHCEIAPRKYLYQYVRNRDSLIYAYAYNEDKLISELNVLRGSELRNEYTYEYNGETLSRYVRGNHEYDWFRIADNRLGFTTGGAFVTEQIFGSCGIVRAIQTINNLPRTDRSFRTEFNSCGEYVTRSFTNGKINERHIEEDDYINPMPYANEYFFPEQDWYLKGNIIKSTYIEDVNGEATIDSSETFTAIYEYDAEGYPLKLTQNFLDGDEEVYTFLYYD